MLRAPRVILLTSDHNEATALGETIVNYASLLPVSSLAGMTARLKEDAYDGFCPAPGRSIERPGAGS